MSELAALISSFVLWQHFCAGSSLFLVLLKVFSPIPHEQVDIPMKNAEISALLLEQDTRLDSAWCFP